RVETVWLDFGAFLRSLFEGHAWRGFRGRCRRTERDRAMRTRSVRIAEHLDRNCARDADADERRDRAGSVVKPSLFLLRRPRRHLWTFTPHGAAPHESCAREHL